MKKIVELILPLILIAQSTDLVAFEVSTHEKLNEMAMNNSLLDEYLISNLGFTGGVTQSFSGQTVRRWIMNGGAFEDEDNWYILGSRYLNHFHNPLKPWSQAGLTDILSGQSSLLWAQRSAGSQNRFGNYSWHDARNYFFKALTSATENDRQNYFAETFRAIGQVMHLIEDASVPAHTRDDAHKLPNYETWAQDHENSLNTTPIVPTVSLSFSIDGKVPITQFWDTNQYDGSVPLIGTSIGIAEFSNANFLSEDTIYKDDPTDPHYFPHPNKSLVQVWVDSSNNREYLRKIGQGEPVEHLAATSLLYLYRTVYFPQYERRLPVGLDDSVYREYAGKLVPRAVGYAAGLLNYFFRGDMDLAVDSENTGMFKVHNNAEEEMSGTFFLYFDDQNDQRKLLTFWSDVVPARSDGRPVSFEVPYGEQPKEAGKFMLVFRGRLGAEENAVVGKIVEVPNHAFVIQRTMTLNANPYEEDLHLNYENWDREGTKVIYPNTNQILTGSFVTKGRITRIELLGGGALWINAAPMSSKVWLSGFTPQHPMTWRVQGGGPFSMEVILADGTAIRQGLFSYGAPAHDVGGVYALAYKEIVFLPQEFSVDRTGEGEKTENKSIVRWGDNTRIQIFVGRPDLYISGGENATQIPWTDVFGNVQIGGSEITYLTPDLSKFSQTGGSFEETTFVLIWEACCGSSGESGREFYGNLEVPQVPSVPLTGQIDRIYSQAELDYLSELGIEPVAYSITLN